MAPRDNPQSAALSKPDTGVDALGSDIPTVDDVPIDAVRGAIRTLIALAGDDPARLPETPDTVIAALAARFAGYKLDAEALLRAARRPHAGDGELVLVRDIPLASHCDHHIAPITGIVHVAYVPDAFTAPAGDVAHAVDAVALRLQSQETMTMQIARAIERALAPRGVGVVIAAQHWCMTTRGVRQVMAATVTSRMTGACDDPELRRDLLALSRR
jgi:GTP cyclohydrolase I